MARELKFRGKAERDGRWVYGNTIICDWDIHQIYIRDRHKGYDATDWEEICNHTFGQFTGLRDKNGKEIYEGDILELVVTYQGKPVGEPRIRKVVWKDSGFYIVNKHDDCVCERSVTCQEVEYRVIGNIYDNPELIKTY